jgi:hypothetical protein
LIFDFNGIYQTKTAAPYSGTASYLSPRVQFI